MTILDVNILSALKSECGKKPLESSPQSCGQSLRRLSESPENGIGILICILLLCWRMEVSYLLTWWCLLSNCFACISIIYGEDTIIYSYLCSSLMIRWYVHNLDQGDFLPQTKIVTEARDVYVRGLHDRVYLQLSAFWVSSVHHHHITSFCIGSNQDVES